MNLGSNYLDNEKIDSLLTTIMKTNQVTKSTVRHGKSVSDIYSHLSYIPDFDVILSYSMLNS